jgi:hypothetical protein
MKRAPGAATAERVAAQPFIGGESRTRAMNLSLPEDDVLARCGKAGVSVSASETLVEGGTHLVCKTIEGADQMRAVFRASIIAGRVRRFAFYRAHGAW